MPFKSSVRAASATVFLLSTLGSWSARADEPTATATSTEETAVVPVASSPHDHMHDGFYARVAYGQGYSTLSADGARGRTDINSGAPLLPDANAIALLGGTPFRGLVIGGGFSAMGAKEGTLHGGPFDGQSVSTYQYTVGPFVDWYPDPAAGLHAGALVGVSGIDVVGSRAQVSLSAAATVFGGWDFWIGKQTSIGVMAMLSGAAPSSLVFTSGTDTGYRVAPLSGTIAFTIVVH